MKLYSQIVIAIATFIMLPGILLGGTITARVDGLVASGTVQMNLDDGGWATQTAGLIRLVRVGGDSDFDVLPDDTNFVAFCVEPREGISLNQTYTWETAPMTSAPTSLGGMSLVQANQIRVLIGLAFADFTASITNLQAAAIQIAIWEIVEETSGTLNVTTGSVRFRNPSIAGTLELAQSLLNQVNSVVPTLTNLQIIINPSNQDLIIQVAGTPSDVSTPEPATLSMLGFGLLALGMIKRKRSLNQ